LEEALRVWLILHPFFSAMDKLSKPEVDNWAKVAKALEKAGKTDCYFYKRAVSIMKTGRDPMRW
jgi:ribosomal protein S19E (S16A)